jgi:hypothetical protein
MPDPHKHTPLGILPAVHAFHLTRPVDSSLANGLDWHLS